MKLITLSQFQRAELRISHPEQEVAEYAALVPESEFRAWADLFSDLTTKFIEFFGLSDPHVYINKLPIFHWTAKLTIPVAGNGKIKDRVILIPKAYKVGVLAEGTYKNFGYQPLLLRLLNGLHSSFDSMADFMPWNCGLDPFFHKNYLGILAWDEAEYSENVGDRYLPMYCGKCIRPKDVSQIEIVNVKGAGKRACLDGVGLFEYVIPSNHYYDNDVYRAKMEELDANGLLSTPLNFQPTRIETFLDFKHEAWSAVSEYPSSEKFRKQAEKSGDHLLIKRDTHKIYSWAAAQSDPVIRLALDMEDEWLWQESCPSPFPNLNLYWTPALEYPWFRDRKTKEWVPAFIIKDDNG